MKNIFLTVLFLVPVMSVTNCNGMQDEERGLENRDERPQTNGINTMRIPIYIEDPDGTIQTEHVTIHTSLYNALINAGLFRENSQQNNSEKEDD